MYASAWEQRWRQHTLRFMKYPRWRQELVLFQRSEQWRLKFLYQLIFFASPGQYYEIVQHFAFEVAHGNARQCTCIPEGYSKSTRVCGGMQAFQYVNSTRWCGSTQLFKRDSRLKRPGRSGRGKEWMEIRLVRTTLEEQIWADVSRVFAVDLKAYSNGVKSLRNGKL